ncbi:hypothetical protein ABE473_04335 [Stenotrophomonas sp. TWI700]
MRCWVAARWANPNADGGWRTISSEPDACAGATEAGAGASSRLKHA